MLIFSLGANGILTLTMAVPSMTDIIDIISTVIKYKLRQRERMSIRKTTIQVGFVDIISSFSQQVANQREGEMGSGAGVIAYKIK
jgi:hypothetical protein